MKQNIKRILKSLLPPVVTDFLKKSPRYGFFGNYPSWQAAQNACTGYDHPAILEKVKNALLKVKNGEAVYERDSVVFDRTHYSWPVLASLLWIASKNDSRLDVLDFGGSLGSSYFQNRDFLKHLKTFSWNIVEQTNFVQCGQDFFEDEKLSFFYSIDACLMRKQVNVFFVSSTLQYLEEPHSFIKKVVTYGFEYVLIDRTPFLKDTDRITMQKVRPGIYDASYPAWFFQEDTFRDLFETKYQLITDFDALAGKIQLKDVVAYEKGFLFKKL